MKDETSRNEIGNKRKTTTLGVSNGMKLLVLLSIRRRVFRLQNV